MIRKALKADWQDSLKEIMKMVSVTEEELKWSMIICADP